MAKALGGGVIVPIVKKGMGEKVEDYRGVSSLPIV